MTTAADTITYPRPAPDAVIPRAMFIDAFRLASRFGHRWAGEVEAVDPDLRQDWTAASIEAHCRAREDEDIAAGGSGWIGGIMAPDVEQTIDGDIYIVHTTGTGRLEWQCWPNRTDLYIFRPDRQPGDPEGLPTLREQEDGSYLYRPGVMVLRANVWRDGTAPKVYTETSEMPFAQRHVQALGDALEALMGLDGLERLARLWWQAEPDPQHWWVRRVEEGRHPEAGLPWELRNFTEHGPALTADQRAHLLAVLHARRAQVLHTLHQLECAIEAAQSRPLR